MAVTITAECPHCRNRFRLQPQMLGKTMRCPNLSCRQVFLVTPGAAGAEEPSSPKTMIDGQGLPPPDANRPDVSQGKPILPGQPVSKPVVEAQAIVEAKVISPVIIDAKVIQASPANPPSRPRAGQESASSRPSSPRAATPLASPWPDNPAANQPREIPWTETLDAPPLPRDRAADAPREVLDLEEEEPVLWRRRQRRRSPALLGALLLGILGLMALGAYLIIRVNWLNEIQLAREAEEALRAGDFTNAAKRYQELLEEFPRSSDRPRYEFCQALATLRGSIQSVVNREDPFPALAKFEAFSQQYRDSPMARPGSGLGTDIFSACTKLLDDLVDYAQQHMNHYRGDRSLVKEFQQAQEARSAAERLMAQLESFRDAEIVIPPSTQAAIQELRKQLEFEQQRASYVAQLREQLRVPSDDRIADAEMSAKERGLANEADIRQMIDTAKQRLLGQVRYVSHPRLPESLPAADLSRWYFAAPTAPMDPAPGLESQAGVFLAVARGLLYALDERTGQIRWVDRVGLTVTDPPTCDFPSDGGEPLALIASDLSGECRLTVRRLKSGEPLWSQVLPAPAAGPATVVARRVYQPLRDEQGTLLEFDLQGGTLLGSIACGQPLAAAPVHRPGTGRLYLPADARRLYVIDVDTRDEQGVRRPPHLVQVLHTGHLPGSLRVPPRLIGPPGFGPQARGLVLAQTHGPRRTRLRVFRLPPEPEADATQPAADPHEPTAALSETPLAPEVEYELAGWPHFPLSGDAEHLLVATDAGHVHLFGIALPGTLDRMVYPVAIAPPRDDLSQPRVSDFTRPRPSLGFTTTDDELWTLTDGQLTPYRLALDPTRGQRLVAKAAAVSLGQPTQPMQVDASRTRAFFVLRDGGLQALAWDLLQHRPLWRRQIGLMPATPCTRLGTHLWTVDSAGGLWRIPLPAFSDARPGDHHALDQWLMASPTAAIHGAPAIVPVTNSDSAAWVVIPYPGAMAIRRLEQDRIILDAKVNVSSSLAGSPIDAAGQLLLPLTDGQIYRFDPDRRRLIPGPVWRHPRASSDAICYLAPGPRAGEFLTTDGERSVRLWRWPNGSADWSAGGEQIVVREAIAAPPILLPGADDQPPALFAVDRTGSAWLLHFTTGEVLRRWRSGAAGSIPLGPPTSAIRPVITASGIDRVGFVIDHRTVVMIRPTDPEAITATLPEAAEGIRFVSEPTVNSRGQWVMLDQTGRITEWSSQKLERLAIHPPQRSLTSPPLGGTFVDGVGFVAWLADGSLAVIPARPAPPQAPAPRESPEP